MDFFTVGQNEPLPGQITPDQLAKCNSESGHQKALFCWININKSLYPQLTLAFSIPNGGLRSKVTAARMVAEGVRKGVSDIFLPFPVLGYHGLFVEMKKPGTKGKREGKPKPEQEAFAELMTAQGYKVVFCWHWQEAAAEMVRYIGGYR